MRRALVGLVVAALLLGTAEAAHADSPTGIDVSRNQSGVVWPGAPDFAIVAVNDGMPNTRNDALPGQLQQAALLPGTTHPRAEVYVNTANPGRRAATWWPSGDRTRRGRVVRGPYGSCRHTDSAACSYVYGASVADDDRALVGSARPARWWLDVEDANTWAGGRIPGPDARARNRAALEGMTAALTGAGQRVGVYALAVHFGTLIGAVPAGSVLAPLPTWLAGARDREQAASFCTRAPFGRGRIQLVQWADRDTAERFDHDLACGTFTATPAPTIRGPLRVGGRLTSRIGAWLPAAHRSFEWTRDGVPVAAGDRYTARAADVGHLLRVVVIGTADGLSRATRTSAAVRIGR